MKKIFFAIIIFSFFTACTVNFEPEIPLEEQLGNSLPENYKVTFKQGGGRHSGSVIEGVYYVENSEITALDAHSRFWSPGNSAICEIVIELGNTTICECSVSENSVSKIVSCKDNDLFYDENDYSMEELYNYFGDLVPTITLNVNGSCYTNTTINGLKTEKYKFCFNNRTFSSYEYSSAEMGASHEKNYFLELT